MARRTKRRTPATGVAPRTDPLAERRVAASAAATVEPAAAPAPDGLERTAARIAWRAANGFGGVIAFDEEGWPQIDLAPEGPASSGEWIDAASKREFRVAFAFDEAGPAAPADEPADVVAKFHELYYDSAQQTWGNTNWLGTFVQKCPLDLWIYQEIIYETRPDLVIETGTMEGGSALFIASMLDLIGQGEIVSVDIEGKPWRPEHPRITYLIGSSTDPRIVSQLEQRARDKDSVMVILDSDHSKTHVLEELRRLSPMVTSGSYLVVEDTNINGNPVAPEFGPGPREAIESFLAGNDDFYVDHSREKFLLTFNPGGYLRRR
jgi:cephalosporin hydroxylase